MITTSQSEDISDRLIEFAPNTPGIPERLLLAHAKGEVVFIAGAGVSLPAAMPDFRDLVLQVYERLDGAVHQVMSKVPRDASHRRKPNLSSLTARQAAEVRRFASGDYDVVLGLLERRLDEASSAANAVRDVVCEILRDPTKKPAGIHRALLKLSERGGATTLLTTNFDRLFERAARSLKIAVPSRSLGSIPRPGRALTFSGILHIHGCVAEKSGTHADIVLSDRDFGEFYLRRRLVPDLIYDLARLFHIVLVGYSANDPPMRYLLNAVAADGSRFDDLKERFSFVGRRTHDPIEIEDWKGRGITPISYDSVDGHQALSQALQAWSALSLNVPWDRIVSKIREIVSQSRALTPQPTRDLFDHLYRRSSSNDRIRIATLVSAAGGSLDWLTAMGQVDRERNSIA